MKVFVVITERDGKINKKPGETTTEITKTSVRFAAQTIEQVWEKFKSMPMLDTEILTAIYEEHPAIVILNEKVRDESH